MLKGKCHCGAVGWTLEKAPESVTSCNCSACRRYGALWTYGYLGHKIDTSGHTSTYRRYESGDGDINFHFCTICGCVTQYVGTIADEEGCYWTAVNVRMTNPTPICELPGNHFDGNDSFERLPSIGRKLKDMWF